MIRNIDEQSISIANRSYVRRFEDSDIVGIYPVTRSQGMGHQISDCGSSKDDSRFNSFATKMLQNNHTALDQKQAATFNLTNERKCFTTQNSQCRVECSNLVQDGILDISRVIQKYSVLPEAFRELDISGHDIIALKNLHLFINLEVLILDANSMMKSLLCDKEKFELLNLKSLVIGSTPIQRLDNARSSLAELAPSLAELTINARYTRLEDLMPLPRTLESLKIVEGYEDNHLKWTDIPSTLTTLVVNDSPAFKELPADFSSHFVNLRNLTIRSSGIRSWLRLLEALTYCPLDNIDIRGNPITAREVQSKGDRKQQYREILKLFFPHAKKIKV